MKRFALIVSAIAMTATAYAQDATEFKSGGEFRARYENYFNKSASDNSQSESHVDARLKYNLNIRKGEKLQAHLGLLHSTRLGAATPVQATPETQGNYTVPAVNGLIVNRAWGWWRGTDAVSFKVGRFGIDIADGAVFSENDWEAVPFAHEGLDVAFDSAFAMFNLYAVKQAELGARAGNSDMEQNYYMLTADLKNMPEAIKMANIHLIDVTRDATGTGVGVGSRNWQHIGLTLGGDIVGFMYKATGAFQFGTMDKPDVGPTRNLSANMFDLMLGYGLPETMGLKVSVGYHTDSGDDATGTGDVKSYQPLFYDRHNYAGLMDVVQWGNLTYFNVNASIMPMEDLEAGAGFYVFSRTKDTGSVTTGDGWVNPNVTVGGASLASGSSLGSEVDVFANKAYGPDMKIGVRYSAFMTGDALKNAPVNANKTAHMGYLQASIGF